VFDGVIVGEGVGDALSVDVPVADVVNEDNEEAVVDTEDV